MHARYLSIILFFSCAKLQAPQEHTETQHHLITINAGEGPVTVPVTIEVKPNIEPHNLFQPENTVHTTSQGFGGIAQSTSSATNTTMNKIKIHLAQTIRYLKTISPGALKTSAVKWASIRKKQIILYSAGISYLFATLILIQGIIFMHKSNTWASWKKQLTLQELLEMPQNQLEKELVHAIQQRHVNAQNPTDHITPLVRFVQQVDREINMVNRYLLLAISIRRCWLMYLFPTNNRRIEQMQELKQRLAFIKHTFISWAATDNLAQFNH